MEKNYTLTIFSENKTGVLSRVVGIITRRHINIMSLSTSPSATPGIHKMIVVIKVTEDQVKRVIANIDKQIDVLKAFYYDDTEIVYQEIALYKIPTKVFYEGDKVEAIVRKYDARVLRIEKQYIVIEKSGHHSETEALLQELQKIGIYEFVRSGRVAIVKPMERLNNYLKTKKATIHQ